MPTQPNPGNPRIPEMVGATSAPLFLGKEPTLTSVTIHPATGPALMRADVRLRRVFVKIENIISDQRAPSYDVYLNVPTGDDPEKHPELSIGSLAMFGLVEASRANQKHPDHGLSYTLEATDVYRSLMAMQKWDDKNVSVSFAPPKGIVVNPKIQVGRVSVYFS